MNETNKIRINSFNTRGMCNAFKSHSIFQWLKTTLIQESHSILTDECQRGTDNDSK